MAIIDFPQNPAAGQTYTFNNIIYTFTSQGVWQPGAIAASLFGPTGATGSTGTGGATGPSAPLPLNYLSGYVLSNDGVTPNTKLDVAAGAARDSGNTTDIINTSAVVIDCTTVGANGMDSGSLAAGQVYHVYAIAQAGGATPAALASFSASAPTMPATYTVKRRVGSFVTDISGHILPFTQTYDWFYLTTGILDVNVGNLTTARSLYTLSVPPSCFAMIRAITSATGGCSVILQPTSETDAAPSGTAVPGQTTPNQSNANKMTSTQILQVDASSQIAARANVASTTLVVVTYGWLDPRGK